MAFLTVIASAAYACAIAGHFAETFFRQVSLMGIPGILFGAAVSIALLAGHGGRPLELLLVKATPLNFLCYLGLGLAIRRVQLAFRTK